MSTLDNAEMKAAQSLSILDNLAQYAHWLPRLALASVFLFHGINKLQNVASFADMMGLASPVAWLVTLGELAIGIGIIVGAFTSDVLTRLAGLLTILIMGGAIQQVHFANGFNFMDGGYEFQLTLLLIGAFFAIAGNALNSLRR